MKRGEIYWANLSPSVGSEMDKTRPVLIISNNLNNKHAATVTILPITSNLQGRLYPFEVELSADESGLDSDSKVKTNQIRTIDKRRINALIGNLSTQKMILIEKAILIHLGIEINNL